MMSHVCVGNPSVPSSTCSCTARNKSCTVVREVNTLRMMHLEFAVNTAALIPYIIPREACDSSG